MTKVDLFVTGGFVSIVLAVRSLMIHSAHRYSGRGIRLKGPSRATARLKRIYLTGYEFLRLVGRCPI